MAASLTPSDAFVIALPFADTPPVPTRPTRHGLLPPITARPTGWDNPHRATPPRHVATAPDDTIGYGDRYAVHPLAPALAPALAPVTPSTPRPPRRRSR